MILVVTLVIPNYALTMAGTPAGYEFPSYYSLDEVLGLTPYLNVEAGDVLDWGSNYAVRIAWGKVNENTDFKIGGTDGAREISKGSYYLTPDKTYTYNDSKYYSYSSYKFPSLNVNYHYRVTAKVVGTINGNITCVDVIVGTAKTIDISQSTPRVLYKGCYADLCAEV